MPLRLLLAACVFFAAAASRHSSAQPPRGGLIQDLFRSVAQAQLEREQRSRLEAEARARGQRTVVPGQNGRTAVPPTGPGFDVGGDLLNQLRTQLRGLTADLQRLGSRNGSARRLVPAAYRLSAEVDEMLAYTGVGDRARLAAAFPAFDRDYREFSFDLSRSVGNDPLVLSRVRQSDAVVNQLGGGLNINPQWDRQQFADLALVTRTILQSVLDDARLISMSSSDRRQINHDINLLITRINRIRSQTDQITFDQASATFNDFAAQLSSVGAGLRRLNDPHIDLRLDRLIELRDQSYGLFWTQPPETLRNFDELLRRMQRNGRELSAAVSSFFTLSDRERREADSLIRDVRLGINEMVRLSSASRSPRYDGPLQAVDANTRRLETMLRYQPGNHHAPLALLRDDVALMMRETSVAPIDGAIDHASLIRLGATLEGGSEALREVYDRRDGSLRSRAYRDSLKRAIDGFYRHARDFYRAVDDRRDADRLAGEVAQLLGDWETMNRLINDLGRQGMNPGDAATVIQYRDALIPAIAEAAALFSGP